MKTGIKRKGTSLVEAGILIGLVAVVSLVSLQALGVRVGNMFTNIANRTALDGSFAASSQSTPPPASGMLSFSPSSLSLNSTTQAAGATQTVTLTNSGASPAPLPSFVFTGTNPSRFEVVATNCISSLPANQSCTLSVRARSGQTGSYSANILTGGANLSVSGTGTGADPSCYEYFGTSNVNMFTVGPTESTGTATIFIMNNCAEPIENISPFFTYNATGTSTPPVGLNATMGFSTCLNGSTIDFGRVCSFPIEVVASRNGTYALTFYLMSAGGVGVDFPRTITLTAAGLTQ